MGRDHLRVTDTLDLAIKRRAAGLPAWRWFDRKVGGHMEGDEGLPSVHVPPQQGEAALNQCLDRPASRQRVIYVHVPYCQQICSFCAFFRKPSTNADLASYTRAVDHQIQRFALTTWASDGSPFKAVYFGGGTPTALPAEQLASLVRSIRANYSLDPDCEITVECRFHDLNEAYLKTLYTAGVNRLSFGVQSFDTKVRQGVGRIADRRTIMELMSLANQVGFEQINVDLIYNLPGQTHQTWVNDLSDLQQCSATAASVYALIPMKGSSLVKQIDSGEHPPLGDMQFKYELFCEAHDALMHRDQWQQFSFHHFGDCLLERSVYNLVRSGGMDTMGIGCGAGGQINDISYMNMMNVQKYVEREMTSGNPGVMVSRRNPAIRWLNRTYQLTDGYGASRDELVRMLPCIESTLVRLIDLHLVREDRSSRLSLTREGCFWGYNISAMISEAIAKTVSEFSQAASVVADPSMVTKCLNGVKQ